jgi:hypothetical protein
MVVPVSRIGRGTEATSWSWVVLFLVVSLLAEAQAQTVSPSVNQVSRQSLLSLVQVNGKEESVTLGNALMGRTNGLEGIVYRESCNGNGSDPGGYVRWYVIFRRIDGKAFPRDESLQLSFLATYTGYEPVVLHRIELRQGEFQSNSSFLAPSYCRGNTGYYWRRIFCRVSSDGRELRGLRGFNSGGYTYNAQQDAEASTKWRSIAIGSAKSLALSESLRSEELTKFLALESKDRWLIPQSYLAMLENLPTDWRELAARPCFALDADDLFLCQPEQTIALRRYIVAGGQLMIANCPEPPEFRADVATWLTEFVPSIAKDSTAAVVKFDTNPKQKVSLLPVGFGRIILCGGDVERFTKPQEAFSAFAGSPRLDRLFDTEMMNWMIPKLGQPPVLMFCLSILAFSILAGPGLLWWTNVKTRRPIWLLLFFPLSALLITSSIFAYALVHDGFGTSGRIRSMTWVDAQNGFGCAYSRQTYFAGLSPAEVAFSNASEVWEVQSPQKNRRDHYRAEPESDVTLEMVDRRQIYRGLLTAREQKQWMVTTPVEALKPFEWRHTAEDEMPRVQNLLGEAWRIGIFVDHEMNIYAVDQVPAKSDCFPRSIKIEDARKLLNDAIPKLVYPDGYFENGSQNLIDWFSNASNYRNATVGNGFSLQVSLETMIDQWPREELMKANRFIILLERADHLDRPFKANVTESDCSHIMMGVW